MSKTMLAIVVAGSVRGGGGGPGRGRHRAAAKRRAGPASTQRTHDARSSAGRRANTSNQMF